MCQCDYVTHCTPYRDSHIHWHDNSPYYCTTSIHPFSPDPSQQTGRLQLTDLEHRLRLGVARYAAGYSVSFRRNSFATRAGRFSHWVFLTHLALPPLYVSSFFFSSLAPSCSDQSYRDLSNKLTLYHNIDILLLYKPCNNPGIQKKVRPTLLL